jgi:hypothetical protein
MTRAPLAPPRPTDPTCVYDERALPMSSTAM